MNIRSKAWILALLLGTHSAAYAEDEKTVGQQLDGAVTAIKEFSQDKKDKTITQVEGALTKLDSRIEELEHKLDRKWESMDSAARVEARHSLQVLHKNRAKVAEWVGSMKQSTSSAWHKMKSGFSNAFSALEESWQDAETDVEQSTI